MFFPETCEEGSFVSLYQPCTQGEAEPGFLQEQQTAMKITVLDGGIINPGDLQWSPITSIAETTIYEETLPEEIAGRTADADVVVVNRLSLSPAAVAQLGEKVRLVTIMGTSADLVALQALEKRSIAVCNVQGYSSRYCVLSTRPCAHCPNAGLCV